MYVHSSYIPTEKKEAQLKEKAILLVEKRDYDIQKAFRRYGFKIRPSSYPRIAAGYREGGLAKLGRLGHIPKNQNIKN